MVVMRAWVGMHCMFLMFLGHTHLLFGTYQGNIGCLVGMQCMIVAFPSHTH